MAHTLTEHDTDALIERYVGPHPANPGLDEYWLKEPGVPVCCVPDHMYG